MEKMKPHYSLVAIKERVAALGQMAFTSTALFNSLAMGIAATEAVDVVLTMTGTMFYKSMTTKADGSLWQDVYHVPCLNGKIAYVKVTMRDGAVVIQFKER